jgi:hypothetical protein
VIIAASKEHIRRLSERLSDKAAATEPAETEHLYALYHNLNTEGQKEVTNLMRLMAYMDAFKKLQ